MAERIAFSVPGQPRSKARPRSAGRIVYKDGKPLAIVTVYSDPATERAEAEVLRCFRARYKDHRPWTGAVMLRFTAIFEPPASWPKYLKTAAATGQLYHTSKPDKDNIEKLIVDSLNGWAFADDAQIQGGGVKRYGSPARLDVILEPLASAGMPPTPAAKAAERRLSGPAPVSAPARRGGKSPKAETKTGLQRAIDAALAKERR